MRGAVQPEGEGQTAEQALVAFDNALNVRSWPSPGTDGTDPGVVRDPGMPDWWTDDEDASQSFLRSMGVQL